MGSNPTASSLNFNYANSRQSQTFFIRSHPVSETTILRRIQVRASNLGWRLFRMNTGLAWVGDKIPGPVPGSITLLNARPFKAGVPGMADLMGWRPVPGQHAQFIAVEAKTLTGRASSEQQSFLQAVNRDGGHGIIARSEDDL